MKDYKNRPYHEPISYADMFIDAATFMAVLAMIFLLLLVLPWEAIP